MLTLLLPPFLTCLITSDAWASAQAPVVTLRDLRVQVALSSTVTSIKVLEQV